MSMELRLFLWAACAGALLLLCYDILAAFRQVFPHGKRMMGIQDFLFWILSGFLLFAGVYRGTGGELRFFLLLGSLLGFFICRETVSPLFLDVLVFLLRFLLIPVKNMAKRLIFPVKRCRIPKKKDTSSNKRLKQIEKNRKKEW